MARQEAAKLKEILGGKLETLSAPQGEKAKMQRIDLQQMARALGEFVNSKPVDDTTEDQGSVEEAYVGNRGISDPTWAKGFSPRPKMTV